MFRALTPKRMRDPKRIDEILGELRRVWEQQPDLRLGQLIVIATRPKDPCSEIFYVEGDKLLDGLLAYRTLGHHDE